MTEVEIKPSIEREDEDEEEEQLTLSADTFAALQQFYVEQDVRYVLDHVVAITCSKRLTTCGNSHV